MAFTKQGAFTFNHVDNVDKPNKSAATMKSDFDSRATDLKTTLNNALDLLMATTDGASGADNIGMTAITETGANATIQSVIEALITRLKAVTDSASGADLIGATAIAGLTGGTVQVLLEALDTALDTHLADKTQHISGNAACSVYGSAVQSIANSTATTLAFNSEDFDTDSIHDTSTNNSRLTCKTAGKYLIQATIVFAYNLTGGRVLYLNKNGTRIAMTAAAPTGVDDHGLSLSFLADLSVNDYLELQVFQNSGGALNCLVSPSRFSMVKVG